MSLYDFVEARRKELGFTKTALAERADIDYSTFTHIKKGAGIKPGTAQKLALALGCSIGDLQAAMATDQDPRRAAAEKKLDGATAGAPASDEEPAEVFNEPVPEDHAPMTATEYKAQLRDSIIRITMEAEPDGPVSDLWIEVGQMVAREVL